VAHGIGAGMYGAGGLCRSGITMDPYPAEIVAKARLHKSAYHGIQRHTWRLLHFIDNMGYGGRYGGSGLPAQSLRLTGSALAVRSGRPAAGARALHKARRPGTRRFRRLRCRLHVHAFAHDPVIVSLPPGDLGRAQGFSNLAYSIRAACAIRTGSPAALLVKSQSHQPPYSSPEKGRTSR
jgi:hypothetical protein